MEKTTVEAERRSRGSCRVMSAMGQKRTLSTAPFYDCFTPKTDTRIGTFGQTGTLGNLIDRPLPAVLSLFHRLQHCLAVLGDLGRDVLLGIALGQCKLNGLSRTHECL
jgi:hypothetical protein